jgi:hypothetical protein
LRLFFIIRDYQRERPGAAVVFLLLTIDTRHHITRFSLTDGHPSTDANNWIYVDLGSTVDIERIIIFWETAYAVRYRLEISDDTNNWTQIFEENNGDGDIDDITVSGTGRYLRMYGVERYNSEWGYSIWEWAVYGSGGATAAPTDNGTPAPTQMTETPSPTPGQGVIALESLSGLRMKYTNTQA